MFRGASLLAVASARIPGRQGRAWFSVAVTDDELLTVVHEAADAVVVSFDGHDDWGLSGGRDGQYASDLVADSAALSVLQNAGLAVLSEESGRSSDAELVAVLDPLDGSTNASRLLPWFATSICVVDGDRPRVAVVHDHASGVRWDAIAGGGARVDGAPLPRRAPVPLDEAIVAINALPSRNPGWGQFRCFGAAALDLCAVADGRFDAYVDFDVDALGPWDYLGGMLVCQEAGLEVVDAFDRPLVTLDHAARRIPVAGRGEAFTALLAARRAEADQ